MKRLIEFLSGYGGLVLGFLMFSGISILGLFHLEEVSILYWIAFSFGAIFFAISFSLNLYSWVKAIVEDYKKYPNIFSFIYDFFASLKLAIFIMLVLGILSMLGSTYIKQNEPFEWYLDNFGYEVGIWIWKLWLNDVFHSWYYIAFIVLLAVNLIVCSIKRLPRVWKQAFSKERIMKLDEKAEKHLKPITAKIS
ncbi:MAG TPA: cytochrome c biogenesis protein, partial [Aquifex aeolicus]|nr:cytochrome c biogenesis protein [Aquifex aeolicus]